MSLIKTIAAAVQEELENSTDEKVRFQQIKGGVYRTVIATIIVFDDISRPSSAVNAITFYEDKVTVQNPKVQSVYDGVAIEDSDISYTHPDLIQIITKSVEDAVSEMRSHGRVFSTITRGPMAD